MKKLLLGIAVVCSGCTQIETQLPGTAKALRSLRDDLGCLGGEIVATPIAFAKGATTLVDQAAGQRQIDETLKSGCNTGVGAVRTVAGYLDAEEQASYEKSLASEYKIAMLTQGGESTWTNPDGTKTVRTRYAPAEQVQKAQLAEQGADQRILAVLPARPTCRIAHRTLSFRDEQGQGEVITCQDTAGDFISVLMK